MNIAILGSGRGTSLTPLLQAATEGILPAKLALVISDKAQTGILSQAKEARILAYYLDPTELSRPDYDALIHSHLIESKIDCILLIGFMRILGKKFVDDWQHKILNIHPALLPDHTQDISSKADRPTIQAPLKNQSAYAGLMDLAVHKAVIASGDPLTGCTVHYVTETVDAGPILIQKRCAVLADDTPETLKKRVQALEAPALFQAILHLSQETVT